MLALQTAELDKNVPLSCDCLAIEGITVSYPTRRQ